MKKSAQMIRKYALNFDNIYKVNNEIRANLEKKAQIAFRKYDETHSGKWWRLYYNLSTKAHEYATLCWSLKEAFKLINENSRDRAAANYKVGLSNIGWAYLYF